MITTEFGWKSQDGLSIFAREWKPESPVKGIVTLVHGLGEHTGRYQHVAAAFCRTGYALVGFDLRGHGRSEGLRGHAPSYDDLMEDIQTALDQSASRFPGLPQFLYGNSMGGNLTLCFGLNRQPKIQGLIVTSPGLKTGEAVPGWKMMVGKLMYTLVPTFQMANGLDLNNLSRDSRVVKVYQDDPLVHGLISARLGLDMINNGAEILLNSKRLELPLLLMQGSADHIVSPEATAQFARNGNGLVTFKMWEGLYHELHNEPEQEEVLATMVSWLNRCTEEKR